VAEEDRIRTGRVSRGVPIARLAARTAASRLAGKVRRADADRDLARFTKEAERYAQLLGDMKGVAMKIGQLVSFLDAGLVPEEYRGIYQQIVGSLQADAPPMSIELVHGVIEAELGRPVDEVFEWFGERPMAAASIGQVHAAHLHGGREVVVKVQYPGVAEAIRSDLANGELLADLVTFGNRLLGPMRLRSDVRAVVDELRDRITEELDYRLEATNQAEFAELYRDHPFIRIPEVVPELSTERVLVMDEADGMRWTAALEQPQALKDTWGEVICRFVYSALYTTGIFNGDPHPGNYLFHEDGSVTFLDFGCVKRFDDEQIALMREMVSAVFVGDGDADRFLRIMQDFELIPRDTKVTAERLLEWYRPMWEPAWGEQPFTYTPEYAAFVAQRNFDPFGDYGDVIRAFGVGEGSKDYTLLNRIQLGMLSVLASLRATGHWQAAQEEIVFGDPPQTDLGHQHAAWAARQTNS
jgi:predicted unusual protein kinase regulating ubiquinone biosynthesis (AarF/ABC1/UbiB family)